MTLKGRPEEYSMIGDMVKLAMSCFRKPSPDLATSRLEDGGCSPSGGAGRSRNWSAPGLGSGCLEAREETEVGRVVDGMGPGVAGEQLKAFGETLERLKVKELYQELPLESCASTLLKGTGTPKPPG